ncbi:MAG: acyl carrier protein [Paludibacteraceae bacterium]|nr:acyl carrier protein [Paludibacteraceae bacterium]
MTREEVITKLTPVARDIFSDETLVLNDEMTAQNVPAWTSLSFMQFLSEIENQFGFKFRMMEILRLQSMGAIIDAIQNHTN